MSYQPSLDVVFRAFLSDMSRLLQLYGQRILRGKEGYPAFPGFLGPGWIKNQIPSSTDSQPHPGRTVCHNGVLGLSRLLFFLLGFLRIRVRGQRASRLEAPVLVAAPHSTFFDPIVLLPCDLPKVVSRAENLSVPVIGGERIQEGIGEGWQPQGPKSQKRKHWLPV